MRGTAVESEAQEREALESEACPYCGAELGQSELYHTHEVCQYCGFHFSLSARERIEQLVDPGTFRETDRSLFALESVVSRQRAPYSQSLSEARARTGLAGAVVTGQGQVSGNALVLVVTDFGFMGGSMGSAVGEKVARAFERAVKKNLPVVSVVTSGGARMQEGVLSLMQMAKTAAAVKRLHEAGLPYISVLANPCTGSAYASFASLADYIVAEPGALIGLAPLRAVQEAEEAPLPHGAHTAEAHLRHGLIDQVVERPQLKPLIAATLDLLGRHQQLKSKDGRRAFLKVKGAPQAWHQVQLARHAQRPSATDYIARLTPTFIELHGDRLFGDDSAIVCGLGLLDGRAVMLIGQERHRGARQRGRPYPEGFRKAHRAMRLASKFHLPLVTLIDTPGAFAGLEAEERGLGNAIAESLALMSDLPTPIVSCIIGEGGSEGALALSVADRLLMQEHAIYEVISPEAAADLIYGDPARAEEIAAELKLTAHDCKDLGVIDAVVPEPAEGAHGDHDEAARLLKRALIRELKELQGERLGSLLRHRHKRYRKIGQDSHRFRAALRERLRRLRRRLRRRQGATMGTPAGPEEEGPLPIP
ncbi:MAG: acetyl-CoA carboxylase carboxyl transferase subunit beta [Chloroflexi bacterium]|nr:acetyl-CoA carboxylase carboxyl transferase subunit beta [Chloroflexota bacterium]